MNKFLNSELALAEEVAARENQQSAELLEALGKIAALQNRMLALNEVIGEMALEMAALRVELKIGESGRMPFAPTVTPTNGDGE